MTAKTYLSALTAGAAAIALIAGPADAAESTPLSDAADTLVELTDLSTGEVAAARKGRVLLTVLHDASGQLDGARFYAGRFIFNQGTGAAPSFDLGSWAQADEPVAAWPNGRPIIVTDLSDPSDAVRGRGLDIAAIDGQIGPASMLEL